LLVGVFFPRKDNGADFGCIWIQSNGVIIHVQIRAVAKANPSNSCSAVLIFGIRKDFLTNLLFTSQKLLMKHAVFFFFGIINEGEVHSDAVCLSGTPNLHNLSNSLMMVYLCIFDTGKAWPWYRDMPSFS
jgi:hypothetical protein